MDRPIRFPLPFRRGAARRGSALVVVLGLLAVMTVLGVAFATFVKTEQAGATSLKNGLVARQTLNTAIGRVMEAIDTSFGNVSNNWAACVWPQPWLASSGEEDFDFFQSVALGVGERPVARIITKEIADMLSPAQLWMARSAQVGWAPIYASVEASERLGKKGAGQYGVEGTDAADSVVGRYAFVALETTGLLGVNDTGTKGLGAADRAATTGNDPSLFIPFASSDLSSSTSDKDPRARDEDDNPIPVVLKDLSKFYSARGDTSGDQGAIGFASAGEAYAGAADAFNLDVTETKPSSDDGVDKAYLPADLFASYAPSLEDLDPDGQPKICFTNILGETQARVFAMRALRAMVKVFANSRYDAERTSGQSVNDDYVVFARHADKRYTLSRARLATVAMIDAMDKDSEPGTWVSEKDVKLVDNLWSKSVKKGGLPDLDPMPTTLVAADGSRKTGNTPADRRPSKIGENPDPANLPYTESAPLVNRVWAQFSYYDVTASSKPIPKDIRTEEVVVDKKITPETVPNESGPGTHLDWSGCYAVVGAYLSGGAVASFQNEVPTDHPADRSPEGNYTLEVEWAALLSSPADSTAKAANLPDDVFDRIVNKPGSAGSGIVIGGGGGGEDKPHRKWKIGGTELPEDWSFDKAVVPLESFSATKYLSDRKSTKVIKFDYSIEANKSVPVEITCYACGWPNDDEPDGVEWATDAGKPDGAWEDPEVENLWYYPPTAEEEEGGEDVFLPVRFLVKVKNKNGNVIQQVPAPAIADSNDKNGGQFWVCANPAVYHPENTVFDMDVAQDDLPWNHDYASGWAMCLDPVFALDTSSLWLEGTSDPDVTKYDDFFGFWINDRIARHYAQDASLGDPFKRSCGRLTAYLDHKDSLDEWLRGPDEESGVIIGNEGNQFNCAQILWLFDTESNFAPVTEFLSRKTKTVPDALHAYKSGGSFGSNPTCAHHLGGPLGATPSGTLTDERTLSELKSHVLNRPFESVGALGRVRIGPYETLSLLRAYRFGHSKLTDGHRVLDYFTSGRDRWPEPEDYGTADGPTVGDDGEIDWSNADDELFSGVHAGRVNLNAPPVVRWTDIRKNDTNDKANRVTRAKRGGTTVADPYPIAAALVGAKFVDETFHDGTVAEKDKTLSEATALSIAGAIADYGGADIDNDGTFRKKIWDEDAGKWKLVGVSAKRRVKSRLSDIGCAEQGGENPILGALVDSMDDQLKDSATILEQLSDMDREAFIPNAADAFTTRGQTFLVIVRADAYTPRYGEESAEDGEGTTLATTHAIVELFRDPVWACYPDGTPLRKNPAQPASASNPAYIFHNWHVKSVTLF